MFLGNLEKRNFKKVLTTLNSKTVNILYLSIFGIYIFCEILLSSELVLVMNSSILSVAKYCLFIIFFMILIYNELKIYFRNNILSYNQLIFGILFLLGLSVFASSKSLHIMVLFTFMFGLSKCPFKSVLKTSLIAMSFTTILVFLMAAIGILPNLIYYRGDSIRYSLGFGASTLSQAMIFFTFMAYFGLKGRKTSIFFILLFAIISLIVYKLTYARASLFLTFFAILIALLCKLKIFDTFFKKITNVRIFKRLFVLFPFILLGGSIFLTYLLDIGNSFAIYLNGLLSTRLRLQLDAFNTYGLTIFGENFITTVNGKYAGVDCSYLFLYFNYGIVATFILLFGYSLLINETIKRKNLIVFCILFIYFIHSFTEPYLIDFKYNPYCLLLGTFYFHFDKKVFNSFELYVLLGGKKIGKRITNTY